MPKFEFGSEASILYHEIFTSIQGEGVDAGKPCTFLRLWGCNQKCTYCDQPQTAKDKKRETIYSLFCKIQKLGIPYVCITGGEPMMQWNPVYALTLDLLSHDFKVAIETNGTFEIDSDPYRRSFKYIMDVKCPSSGVNPDDTVLDNLMRLQSNDEVVFVIQDKKDYNYAKKVMSQYPTQAQYVFSPCFDREDEPMIRSRLVDWMIKDKLWNVRLSVQMHKVIGVD